MKQVKYYSMQMLMTMALVFTMMMSMGMKASATSRVNIADLTVGQILEQGTVIIGDEGYLNYCLSESDANEGLYQSYDSLEEGSVTLSNQMTGEYCNGISVTSPAGLWKVWSVTETVGDLDVYLIPFVEERRGEGWHLDAQGCLHLTGSIHVSEEIPWSEFREEILTVVAEEGASVDTGEFLFYDCGNLRMADLSKLDVSKVKIMNNMFACCSNLTSLNLTGWNTSNVTDMRLMFNFCRQLYDLDLSSFDTSHVTDMSDMFDMCERLSSLDLKNFNTSNVTSMRNMFWFCLNLSSLNVSSFNTSKVVDMESMFYMCEKLTSLDVSSFDTSKVESMDGMFWGCSSLTKLDVSNFSTASIKTSGAMNDMFRNCDALTELSTNEAMLAETAEPLIIFHAAWKNKDNNQIYQTLDQLKNITGKVTLVTLIGAGDGWYIDNDGCMHITGRLWLDCDDFLHGYVNPYWYEYEKFVTSIVAEEGAETWIGNSLFSHFYNMTSADLSKLDTSNVDDMQSMFQGCYKLKTLNLSGFDTSHVVSMYGMFDECSSLTALDLSSFDTSNVWDMNEMFRCCHSLETLDLSGFETCKVKYMGYMFGDCKSLTSLNISNFDTSLVADVHNMFDCCDSLTSLDVSSFSLPLLQDVDAATGQDNLSLMYLFDAPRKKVTIDSALLARFGQRVFEHNPMWVNQSHDQIYLTKDQLNNLSGKVTMATVFQVGTNWYCDGFGDLHLFGEIDNASTAAAENTPWKDYKEQIERVIADSKTVISNGTYLFTNYPNLKELTFEGDAPAFADNSFKGVTATVKYPANNATWTEVVKKQYGGKITWKADGTAPIITKQPSNVTAKAGDKVSFAVTATGDGLTYQWQYRNAGVSTWSNSGAAAAKKATFEFTVGTDKTLNGRQYRCVVTDKNGKTATSNAATLTVTTAASLAITKQPSNVTAKAGDKISFAVTATGEGLTYQWQYRNAGVSTWSNSGAAAAKKATFEFTVGTDKTLNGRQYRCVVTDKNGKTATSNAATLTVTTAASLAITKQPSNVTAKAGDKISFAVTATGEELTYQWQYRNAGVSTWSNSGAAAAKKATFEFTVGTDKTLNGRQYRCVVTDKNGKTATSNAATLTVTTAASLAITKQPSNVTAKAGDKISFEVTATGDGLTYQWQYRNAGVSTWSNSGAAAAKKATFEFTVGTDKTLNGREYRCVVTDKNGKTVTSNAATLTVTTAASLAITKQPVSVTAKAGDKISFEVTATGEGLTYQWQYRNAGVSTWSNSGAAAAKKATFEFTVGTDKTLNGREYRCVVTDKNGKNVTSNAATLYIK